MPLGFNTATDAFYGTLALRAAKINRTTARAVTEAAAAAGPSPASPEFRRGRTAAAGDPFMSASGYRCVEL